MSKNGDAYFNPFSADVFYEAIEKALERKCFVSKGTREPCYTARITRWLPEILESFRMQCGYKVKYQLGACYVHQKPYVKFGSNWESRCELGDLLVLMKKRNSGSFSYNSALFQLKQADNKINYVIKNNSNEDKQLSLYSNWGILKIDLKSDEQTVYDITPHTVSQGGMYMFIRSKTPRLVVASPCRNMKVRPPSLGVYLSNMAEWRCGRSIAGKIDVDGNRADDWSRLIWRVIELVQNAKCKCKGYGNGNVKRDNGCGAFSLISGEIPFVKNYIEVVSLGEYEDKFETDQETGFGVLFIEQLEEDESILKSKHERFS